MYIDDDPEDTQIFQEAIESVDSRTIFYSASDGYEGFQVLEQITVDPAFIFLDVNMPRMNGKEFLSEIKKKAIFRSIPVVMYSTTSQTEEISDLQRDGSVRFYHQTR